MANFVGRLLVVGLLLGAVSSLSLTPAAGQISWGRGKEKKPMLPNPYTFTVPRDTLLESIKQVLSDRELIIDEKLSAEKPGRLVTQPVIFTRGALTSGSNLEFIARRPGGRNFTWVRGRYALELEALPLDPQRTRLTVYARIEGEYQTETGGVWVECPSRGVKENEILEAIIKHLNGES
ncbi:MAG: hypothetical protein SNJ67_04220 [Chloracidobacterium sp.]|uniref:DUF4136 domain-containing protein n=1 Tax=Chloracidobacterium validum TaxID=2821543 RepID=A0ABX8B5F5_9BACT|nr:hypothetical protein [Chloracidobacterium validum]QUW02198.1 hypothetical protein J8C06_07445 [Chloracidobacterium validum]